MARQSKIDIEKVSEFSKWLLTHIERRGTTVQRVADEADMHVSQLHKIIKSYMPTYSSYQRPGFEKTVAIGKWFGDVEGALVAAGYEAERGNSDQNQDREYVPGYNGMIAIPGAASVSISGYAFDRLSPKSREMLINYAQFLEAQDQGTIEDHAVARETEKATE